MKTLVESLFDRDLVEKNLPVFGNLYKVKEIRLAGTRRGIGMGAEKCYSLLMSNFNEEKLKKDIKPLDLSKVQGYDKNLDELQYLLALIANITVLPSDQKSWNPFEEILKEEIQNKTFKYKKSGHWVNNRAFIVMFLDNDGFPYIRIGRMLPDYIYVEIYYKEK